MPKVAVSVDFNVPFTPATKFWEMTAFAWAETNRDPLTLATCPKADVEKDTDDAVNGFIMKKLVYVY